MLAVGVLSRSKELRLFGQDVEEEDDDDDDEEEEEELDDDVLVVVFAAFSPVPLPVSMPPSPKCLPVVRCCRWRL